jgi:hypothetical protein
MEKARSWYVESKKFVMLVKGGNSGLRIVERGKKKQSSIFLQRGEIAWLVDVLEGVVDVDTSKVFWDPSSAGFPRVLVQRRTNRHGNFIFIEEYEGRKRRGSILIPEGRYGQGWTRLVSEMRFARSTLWKGREFRVRKTTPVDPGRTFAEVLGRSKMLENEAQVMPAATEENSVATGTVGELQSQKRPATSPSKIAVQIGKQKAIAVAGGHVGVQPAKSQVQAKEKGVMGNGNKASLLFKTLQNPEKSGMEASIQGWESEGQGHASVHDGLNLQGLTKCLVDIRDELTLGLKRVEMAFQMLNLKERVGWDGKNGVMGFGENRSLGSIRSKEGVGWSKPKKKAYRRKNIQPGLLGPKPSKESGSPGPMGSFPYRIISRDQTQKPVQAGESAAMGAARGIRINGAPIAGDSSGVHSSGAGAHILAGVEVRREAENDDIHDGGVDLGERMPAQKLESVTEEAEELGYALSSPEKSCKLPDFSTSWPSTIPESDEAMGQAPVSPVKRRNGLSVSSEDAGDVGIASITPDKQPKQLMVFQRRESPAYKTTKSWVAERVSWNGGGGCDAATEVILGKNLISEMEVEELMGEPEELGLMGGRGNQDIESPVVEGSTSMQEVESFPEEQAVQEMGLASPIPKKLELVWEVKGTAGMSWGGQDGKLKQVFGQIVDDKQGEGAWSAGVKEDGFMGMRDDDITYEA